jgi:protease-4
MLENKLGISFDRVSTNQHAVLSTNRKLTASELAITQEEVDEIYDQFLQRVSDGRKMTKGRVNVIARGRVWTGRDALRIGLVDQLGGLSDAIAFAASEADLKTPKVLYYPLKKEDKLGDLIELIEDQEEDESIQIKSQKLPQELMDYYTAIKKIERMRGIQMRLPFEVMMY